MHLIVVGVVIGPGGVLIGRRADGVPPWVFPGGKVEPAETPDAALAREVREETGLAVEVHGEIGRRRHPSTGADVVYLAARPVTKTEVVPSLELVELRWVSLGEALELLPSMFGPVRDYLAGR